MKQATAVLEDHQKAQVERLRDALGGGGCWLGDKGLQGPGGAGYGCAGGSPEGTGRERETAQCFGMGGGGGGWN